MLIGAHVSTAGGLATAIERGVERGCRAIQIFNQSPRMWRPTNYTDDDFAAFRESIAASGIDAVMIHAVYLLNAASEDSEIVEKSRVALTHALRIGDAIDAHCVVLHPGSAKTGDVGAAIKRAGKVFKEVLTETDRCPLHLENTAGAGGTLGRTFDELAALIEAAGGDRRLGICLDSAHLFGSGYDIRTPGALASVLDDGLTTVGRDRLGSLHLNDSQATLGSNRDRHALLGEGELGDAGCAVFLSEPRFDDLPCVLETGEDGAPSRRDVDHAKALRKRGLAARRRRRGG
jgi:deoxyribonuclease IV